MVLVLIIRIEKNIWYEQEKQKTKKITLDRRLSGERLKTTDDTIRTLELLKGTIRKIQGTIGTIMKAPNGYVETICVHDRNDFWARLARFVGKTGTI